MHSFTPTCDAARQVLESTRDMTGHSGLHLILTAVHALIGARFPSGNLPSSIGSSSDK